MCIEPPLPPHSPSGLPKISSIMPSTSQPLAMQWPWPRWVLAILSRSVEVHADADGGGFLAGIEMHEAGNAAGRELDVHPLLEIADRAHHAVRRQKLLAIELHGCRSPVVRWFVAPSLGQHRAAEASRGPFFGAGAARWRSGAVPGGGGRSAGRWRIRARRCCTATGCAHHGIAGAYLPLPVQPGRLEAALRGLAALGFAGCNVTRAAQGGGAGRLVDTPDAAAPRHRRGEPGRGAPGRLAARRQHRRLRLPRQPARARARLAGGRRPGGGARRRRRGARGGRGAGATPARRTCGWSTAPRERAEALAAELGGPMRCSTGTSRARALEGAALLVNTTTPGHDAASRRSTSTSPRCRRRRWCATSSTCRWRRPLLAAARARGNPVVDGLGMLLHQAVPAFEAWFGVRPEVTPELRAQIEATVAIGR